MKKIYLKVEVPDDLPVIAVHLVTETEPVLSTFTAQRVKLSNNFYANVPFTEIQLPTEEEMQKEMPHDPNLPEIHIGNMLTKALRTGAKWAIEKIKAQ